MIRCTVALNIRGSDLQMRPNHANRKHGDERNKSKHPAVCHPNSNRVETLRELKLPRFSVGKGHFGVLFCYARKEK